MKWIDILTQFLGIVALYSLLGTDLTLMLISAVLIAVLICD